MNPIIKINNRNYIFIATLIASILCVNICMAELPLEAQADLNKAKIKLTIKEKMEIMTQSINNKDYKSALDVLKEIKALDFKFTPEILFIEGMLKKEIKDWEGSKKLLEDYIVKVGKNGKRYNEAILLLAEVYDKALEEAAEKKMKKQEDERQRLAKEKEKEQLADEKRKAEKERLRNEAEIKQLAAEQKKLEQSRASEEIAHKKDAIEKTIVLADSSTPYELTPSFSERDLVDINSGLNYQIKYPVQNNGFMNQYSISSDIMNINVSGNGFVNERTHEIDVIYAMKEIEETEAFMKGFDSTVNNVVNVTEKTLADPIKAVGTLQKGIDSFLYDINASMNQMGSGDSSDTLKSLVGLTQTKRDLAVEFNIDFYSSNELLQEHLEKLSTAVFYGGFSIKAGLQAAPGAASVIMTTADIMKQGSSRVWLKSPESLRMKINDQLSVEKNNKELLTVMQTSSCSVSHLSNIAGALIRIEPIRNKNEIFKWALTGKSEEKCRRITELIRLAWLYHDKNAPLESLWIDGEYLLAKDALGKQVIFLVADYLTWNALLDKMLNLYSSDFDSHVLCLSNDISNIAKTVIEKRDIEIVENLILVDRNIVSAEILFADEYEYTDKASQSPNQTGELLNDTTTEVNKVVDGLLDGVNSIFGIIPEGSENNKN